MQEECIGSFLWELHELFSEHFVRAYVWFLKQKGKLIRHGHAGRTLGKLGLSHPVELIK